DVTDAPVITLPPGGTRTIEVTFRSDQPGPHAGDLHVRQMTETEIVAQAVALRGTVTGTTAVSTGAAPGVRLEAGRPNPFGAGTTVAFALARPERIRLDILDVHGRSVATLAEGMRAPGEYRLRWTAREQPSGIYFARLRAGEVTLTRKLVHTR